MAVNCGIVGLPNVGKSTLFNALTQTMIAEAANYPFCTIEPNVGKVAITDLRLENLAEIAKSEKIIYNQLQIVDIAGLVRGASKGEGLGNKFLSHIREVDAIIHVLRCFENENIPHVHNKVAPVEDAEVVEMELILADIDSLERRLPALEKSIKSKEKESKHKLEIVLELIKFLQSGNCARNFTNASKSELDALQLLTTKPIIYVCNVEDFDVINGNSFSQQVYDMAMKSGSKFCCISAKLESDLVDIENVEEKAMFLAEFKLEESGLNKILKMSYDVLNMITFFTVGVKEARAWPIKEGTSADKAAGVIHTDFEKGFIKAETISYKDYIHYKGAAKEAGKIRFEGRDYIVKDGDILHFRFNN